MKRILTTVVLSVATVAALSAQSAVSDKMSVYELSNSRLHLYQTGDAMGDVSFIIEGDKKLVILEQPLFWENITEFNAYVESLDKPIERVVANYHSLGLADYKPSLVVMPEAMLEFNKSAAAHGMITKFKDLFGEAADFRPYTKAKGIALPSVQRWAGVEFQFTNGAKSDFPAANILIDGKAFYRHFAPSISHFSPMQIKSMESVEIILAELKAVAASGAEFIFGSHGAAATQTEVAFQIEYLEKVKELRAKFNDPDSFGQQLIIAYPTIAGGENIKAVAKALYPDVEPCAETEAVRSRVQDYFNMVSNIDREVAEGLWAKSDDISIITPRTHFVGFDAIMDDFLTKAFSSMQSRKLHSLNEVINIYGDGANVQLYWIFDTVDAKGVAHQSRGRESLIFSKIDGEWRLVHVHYSRLL
ncbi:MAG: nuclear transport factor 2 family protein [Rikenellaceae bacterium]